MTSTQINAAANNLSEGFWLKEIALQLAILNEARSLAAGPPAEKWPGVTWNQNTKSWDKSTDATTT